MPHLVDSSVEASACLPLLWSDRSYGRHSTEGSAPMLQVVYLLYKCLQKVYGRDLSFYMPGQMWTFVSAARLAKLLKQQRMA